MGLAGVDARFIAQTSWPTPKDAGTFVKELARAVEALRADHRRISCEGMGVSLPGRVDRQGRLVFAPNLGLGTGGFARTCCDAAVGLPVNLENAANACALAELWFGRHPEHVRNVIAVTVSEGIGVGLLLNGQLVHGADAMAGEFGHVSRRRAGAAVQMREARVLGALCLELRGGRALRVAAPASARAVAAAPAPVRFEDLVALADAGDRRAGAALDRMGRYLGDGLAALVNGLAPEVIAIVGEVTGAWERIGPLVDARVKARALPHQATRIVATDRSTQPRLRGAVTLVVQQHFGAPNVA